MTETPIAVVAMTQVAADAAQIRNRATAPETGEEESLSGTRRDGLITPTTDEGGTTMATAMTSGEVEEEMATTVMMIADREGMRTGTTGT
jgi:hypothetical protein